MNIQPQLPTESDIPMHGWSPYDEVHRERIRAHIKHGPAGHSCEQVPATDREWLAILMEEVGEVAHELTYDSPDGLALVRKELVQVAAMAVAWIVAIDRQHTAEEREFDSQEPVAEGDYHYWLREGPQ